jgi:hypothetical protein
MAGYRTRDGRSCSSGAHEPAPFLASEGPVLPWWTERPGIRVRSLRRPLFLTTVDRLVVRYGSQVGNSPERLHVPWRHGVGPSQHVSNGPPQTTQALVAHTVDP